MVQRIAESELILNDRGAVYHLNLRPEELAATVITVGDPDRVALVSRHLDTIDVQQQHREFVTHTGWLAGKRISVISTGIGPDNMDIVLNELDALVNIDLETRQIKEEHSQLQIIRIGTAGSLQQAVPVDSFVASTHGLGLDNLLNYYRLEQTEEECLLLQNFVTHTQLGAHTSHPYLSRCSVALLKHFAADFYSGITVTCPGFYAPQGRVLRLGIRNPDLINRLTQFQFGQHRILNFEMETAALYGLGRMLGHQCLSLSAIVANRIEKQFSKNSHLLVERLIEKSLHIISTI
jgi:uridine phosphorylase